MVRLRISSATIADGRIKKTASAVFFMISPNIHISRQVFIMKITYTNKPMNRQSRNTASLKTIILMSCIVACMVAVKVIYNPTETMEDVAAMAQISGETIAEETEEVY